MEERDLELLIDRTRSLLFGLFAKKIDESDSPVILAAVHFAEHSTCSKPLSKNKKAAARSVWNPATAWLGTAKRIC